MMLLQTNNVLRRFGADVLFHNVNLQITDHARVALVGRNGAGKTTLLKMIAGITSPDEGTITTAKNLSIGYLAQDQGLDSENSIWAELDTVFAPLHAQEAELRALEQKLATVDATSAHYQELLRDYDRRQESFRAAGGFEAESRMRGVLRGFGFGAEMEAQPVNTLSGGQKTKLALAKILLQAPDLLILDEPTNHLDMGVLSWLEDYLKGYSGALLVVSHDRYFLDRVVTEVNDLDNRTLTHYRGNYSAFVKQKTARLKTEMKHYEHQQKEIAKLEDFVNKNLVRASTTKQAQARRRQLEKMDRLERPVEDDRSIHFAFHSDKESGTEVLDVAELVIGYQDRPLAGPLTFSERRGQRMGIIGPNGIGKSTLLKTLLKKQPPLSGTIKFGASLSIGYYDQEQQQLHPAKTVLDEVWDDHPDMTETAVRSLLGSFLFVGDDVYKQVADLSGGQKARLELTKLSLNPTNYLILDEPTNHLDIDSREVLEAAINDFSGTVLFISHDRYFINQVATDVLAMKSTGITRYQGNYDDYLTAIAAVEQTQGDASTTPTAGKTGGSTTPAKQQSYQAQKDNQRARRKLERAADQLEERVTKLTERQEELETAMAAPEVATDLDKLTDLQKELDQVTTQLAKLEDEWTTAAEALEEFDQQ